MEGEVTMVAPTIPESLFTRNRMLTMKLNLRITRVTIKFTTIMAVEAGVDMVEAPGSIHFSRHLSISPQVSQHGRENLDRQDLI